MSGDTLIFLLQHLSFAINQKNLVLKLSLKTEFLGLKIDTHTKTSPLTEEKIKR